LEVIWFLITLLKKTPRFKVFSDTKMISILKKLNKYTWLSSRKLIAILLFYDFFGILVSLVVTNIAYNFYFIELKEALIIFIFYSSLSYIFGRYKLQNRYGSKITKKFIIKDLIYIFILIIIYLLVINILYENQENNLLYMRKFPFLILSFIVTTLSSIKIKRNFRKLYKNQNKLFFYGTESEYQKLNKILNKENKEFKYSIKLIEEGQVLENYYNGILFSKKLIKDYDFKFLINLSLTNKINLYPLDDWLENNLNRIPNEYINFEKFFKKYNAIKQNNFHNRLKRFGDIFFSISLLFLSLPILFIAGILIWINDRGSIIYKQKRVGKNGKKFYIYKLRTMILNAEKKSGPQWVSINDRRITFIGKLLRKTRIDEIPQLICVLNGDMSLIGPRPERPELEVDLKANIDNYELRYLVKPGLSGWAQVNANYAASIEGVKLKLSYDLYYIFNQSLLIDFLIFIKTIKVVFTAKGSDPIY